MSLTHEDAQAYCHWLSKKLGQTVRLPTESEFEFAARALSAPVDSLVGNWADMVMTSLAWTLKAWSALLLPITPRHREAHAAARTTWLRMEFKTFVNEVLKVPCQIVRQGRRVIHRVLHWNRQLPTLFRLATALNC
ncbi:MAG: SUMF1/EgtB/PvdO family nonheme iron enzyme [Planctomycetaceae bacterium]